MVLRILIIAVTVSAVIFFGGCGKYPVDSGLTATQQWLDYERYSEYKVVKKEFMAGNYEQVITDGTEFVRHYANDLELEVEEMQYLIAESYFLLGRYDFAVREYKKVALNYPYSTFCPLSMMGEGNCYRLSSRYTLNEAITQYQAFIEKFPQHNSAAEAQFRIGECRYRAASTEVEFDAAVADLKKTLEKYPLTLNSEVSRQTNLYLGKCYEERPVPDYPVAIQYYQAFVLGNDTYLAGDVFYRIGVLYQEKLLDSAEAKNAYYSVITHFANSTYYNEALVRYNAL
ncbi:MAG: tetratricopeptide repeat protein [Candidatus Wallbacteria bacterium]|nr:tetratricopeptide repeat protein [Candidatus Wallbacteria bacterium]